MKRPLQDILHYPMLIIWMLIHTTANISKYITMFIFTVASLSGFLVIFLRLNLQDTISAAIKKFVGNFTGPEISFFGYLKMWYLGIANKRLVLLPDEPDRRNGYADKFQFIALIWLFLGFP